MVYRLQTTAGDWMDFRQVQSTVDEWEYRSNSNTNWRMFFLKARTVDEINKIYGSVGFSLVTTTPGLSGIYPNDLQLDIEKPTGIHKCYCNWDKVWREGCDCGGL